MATGLCGTCGGSTPGCGCYVTAGSGIGITGDGSSGSPFVVTAKNRQQLANPIRNASMQVAQRGTSIAVGAATVMTLDGWWGVRTGAVAGQTVSQQTTLTDTQGSGYCARVQRDSGNTAVNALNLVQSIVTVDSRRWANRPATFSFRARKGANFSAASDLLTVTLSSGTGTDQSVQSGFTGSATVATVSATLTTSWQTFTATATPGASITQLGMVASYTPVGTASTNDYFEIKDVRLDEGAYAQEHVPNTYAADLADAQYYLRYFSAASSAYLMLPMTWKGTASIFGSNAIAGVIDLEMRAVPAIVMTGSWAVTLGHSSSVITTLSAAPVPTQGVAGSGVFVYCYCTGATTENQFYFVMANNDTTARMSFGAEI